MCRSAILGRVALLATLLAPIALTGTAFAQTGDNLDKMSHNDANWVMAPKDYANTRYSGLNQINTKNVGQLQLAWAFSMGTDRGQEAAPLVINGTMYVVGPYFGPHPNEVFALNAATGDLKWSYSPKPNLSAIGVACCDVVTRGLAYDNGKIFLNTLDDYTVAIDANTGKELWHTKLGDINQGETITMAPLVVKGKVLVGNSGGELGVRGWLTALDENTGKIAWRAYSTGPDKDVLIGKDFKPFYDWAKGKDMGVKTWPPDAWKIGGGTVWGWIEYDPKLNLIYYGTANAGPWNASQRPGDNLWTSTIFARDPDTGMAKWAYPMIPHELWDHDEIIESILVDLPINGKTRKVMLHPARNGYFYVIDRTNGQVLSAKPYIHLNEILGIDFKTGRPKMNPDLKPAPGKTLVGICPNQLGGKDWEPSSYSPRTGYVYIPTIDLCMNWYSYKVGYIAGTPYVGAALDSYTPPGTNYRGEFQAWDPIKQKQVWSIHEKFPVFSGTMVTGGDVAFYGTLDRWFKAVDAKTGKVLWKFRAPAGIMGQPVTYEVNGVQYVAILCGPGGGIAGITIAKLNPRIRNAALGTVGATQDLPVYTAGGGTLLVFALPASVRAATKSQPAPVKAGSANPPPKNAPKNGG